MVVVTIIFSGATNNKQFLCVNCGRALLQHHLVINGVNYSPTENGCLRPHRHTRDCNRKSLVGGFKRNWLSLHHFNFNSYNRKSRNKNHRSSIFMNVSNIDILNISLLLRRDIYNHIMLHKKTNKQHFW